MTERMRKDESIQWQLSEQEQDAIRLQWAKKVVKKSDTVEAILKERFEQAN